MNRWQKLASGLLTLMIVVGTAAQAIGAAEPTTATRPAVDLSTPEKTMNAMLDAIEAEDLKGVRATLAATKRETVALADDVALIVVTKHRFHRIFDKKFPGKEFLFWKVADDATLKRLRATLAKTTFTSEGDKASAVLPKGADVIHFSAKTVGLVRIN